MANNVLDTRIMVKGDPSTVKQSDIVFDNDSLSRESRVFQARDIPAVVTGYNIHASAEIYLEVIEQTPTLAAVNLCDCYIEAQQEGRTISINRIRCPFQPMDEMGTVTPEYIRLTADNPMLRIDLPAGTYFRLVWDGPGYGEADAVVRLRYTDDEHVLDACSTGCPNIRQSMNEGLWVDTGVRRCNVENGKYEWQYAGPDGQVVWRQTQNLVWGDTCCTREMTPVSDTQYEQQQTDQCGDVRWVTSPHTMDWTDTFEVREKTPASDDSYEKQQVNNFGRYRWVEAQGMEWTATGKARRTDTGDKAEYQEVNQFGRFRWRADKPIIAPYPLMPKVFIQLWATAGSTETDLKENKFLKRQYRVDEKCYAFDEDNKPQEAVIPLFMNYGKGWDTAYVKLCVILKTSIDDQGPDATGKVTVITNIIPAAALVINDDKGVQIPGSWSTLATENVFTPTDKTKTLAGGWWIKEPRANPPKYARLLDATNVASGVVTVKTDVTPKKLTIINAAGAEIKGTWGTLGVTSTFTPTVATDITGGTWSVATPILNAADRSPEVFIYPTPRLEASVPVWDNAVDPKDALLLGFARNTPLGVSFY